VHRIAIVIGVIAAPVVCQADDAPALPRIDPFADAARAWSIPALDDGFIPQGIAHLRAGNVVAISLYDEHHQRPSRLAFVDATSGYVATVADIQRDGEPFLGHVGGLAACRGDLWMCCDGMLHRIDLPIHVDGVQELSIAASYPVDSHGSFLCGTEEHLWIGDFVVPVGYTAPRHHRHGGKRAWVARYQVGPDGALDATDVYSVAGRDVLKPDQVVFVRQMVQGFAVMGDRVVLSISYGPKNSRLALYRAPFDHEPFAVELPDGHTTEGFLLNGENHLETVELPAGSEDLEWTGSELLVPFESAADKYRKQWSRLGATIEDRFYMVPLRTGYSPVDTEIHLPLPATHDGWMATPLRVRKGQMLVVDAEGEISLHKDELERYPFVTADGDASQIREFAGIRAPNGSLLLRIAGVVVAAGQHAEIESPASGSVDVGILERGAHENNAGEFRVTVRLPADDEHATP